MTFPLCRTIAVLVATSAIGTGCARKETTSTSGGVSVERGRYLATIVACNDCHSPKIFTEQGPVPDTTRLLAGHMGGGSLPALPAGLIGPNGWGGITSNDFTAWSGPWGTSYAANLTPDSTGLAGWTADEFMQAMRTGKHRGTGRPILPPMPWPALAAMTDDDLRSIFAYLQSLPPVTNQVPPPVGPAMQ